ncbi:MAG: hypothetical protein M5R41_02645 [Bacteroidia bacterium]|nr:hypothetical protein [Bacteroidia bacterium]
MKTAMLAVLLLIPTLAGGQNYSSGMVPYESDILSAKPVRTWLGLGVGGYGFWHNGNFSPNCDCSFGGEKGGAPMFALDVTRDYPKLGFAIRALLTYYDVSSEFSYEETRRTVIVGDEPDQDVRYRKTSDVTLRYIAFTPSFAWYFPQTPIYVQGGLELGFPLKYRYDNVERILTPDLVYNDGSSQMTLLAESDIPGGKSLRLAAALGAGADLQLSSMIMITPQVGVNLPLTTVSSDDSWSVTTVYGLLFLKIRLW